MIARPATYDWRIMKAQKPHLRASHKAAKHRLMLHKLGYIPEI